ncbi:MAG TPA: DUF5320 domain-containing protein [Phycisphaerae bacterium]|nr:DUF5320 domain-containing protein [Phycisphaerae bacterium]
MPGGDGTGPMGMGPMSGRGAGYCAGYPAPGFMNPVGGRGFFGRGFRGRGGGRGQRNMFWATGMPGWARAGWGPTMGAVPPYGATAYAPAMPREAELDALKSQADYFRGALDEIQKRLGELQAAQSADKD